MATEEVPVEVPADEEAGSPTNRKMKKKTVKSSKKHYLIGRRIKVWWPLDNEYYRGEVVDYNEEKGRTLILYDDGEYENLDLQTEIWKCEGEDTPQREGAAEPRSTPIKSPEQWPEGTSAGAKNGMDKSKALEKADEIPFGPASELGVNESPAKLPLPAGLQGAVSSDSGGSLISGRKHQRKTMAPKRGAEGESSSVLQRPLAPCLPRPVKAPTGLSVMSPRPPTLGLKVGSKGPAGSPLGALPPATQAQLEHAAKMKQNAAAAAARSEALARRAAELASRAKEANMAAIRAAESAEEAQILQEDASLRKPSDGEDTLNGNNKRVRRPSVRLGDIGNGLGFLISEGQAAVQIKKRPKLEETEEEALAARSLGAPNGLPILVMSPEKAKPESSSEGSPRQEQTNATSPPKSTTSLIKKKGKKRRPGLIVNEKGEVVDTRSPDAIRLAKRRAELKRQKEEQAAAAAARRAEKGLPGSAEKTPQKVQTSEKETVDQKKGPKERPITRLRERSREAPDSTEAAPGDKRVRESQKAPWTFAKRSRIEQEPQEEVGPGKGDATLEEGLLRVKEQLDLDSNEHDGEWLRKKGFEVLRQEKSAMLRQGPPPGHPAAPWWRKAAWEVAQTGGVAAWLFRLGLGSYAPLLSKHEVDCEVLPLLTWGDLKDMGVVAVGPRRKMLAGIAELAAKVIGVGRAEGLKALTPLKGNESPGAAGQSQLNGGEAVVEKKSGLLRPASSASRGLLAGDQANKGVEKTEEKCIEKEANSRPSASQASKEVSAKGASANR